MALFSFRQAELFFLGGAEAPPAPLGRSPVARACRQRPKTMAMDQEGNIVAPGHNMRVQAGDPMHRPHGDGRQWVEGWRL